MTPDQSLSLLEPMALATVTIEIKQKRQILTSPVSTLNDKFQASSYTTYNYKETMQHDIDSSSVQELKVHLEELLASTQRSNGFDNLPVNQQTASLQGLSKSSIPMARKAIYQSIVEPPDDSLIEKSNTVYQANVVSDSTTNDDCKEPSVEELYELSRHTFKLVQKYCRLAKVQNPTPDEDRQLDALLLLAEYDDQLSTLFDEATELLNYELGIMEE